MKSRNERAVFRKIRVRAQIVGSSARPRLSVFRSLKHIYAQVIDDSRGMTLAAASTRDKGFSKAAKTELAQKVGEAVAKRALEKGVQSVVYDRGSRPYHGRVKAVAEGARQAGLKF